MEHTADVTDVSLPPISASAPLPFALVESGTGLAKMHIIGKGTPLILPNGYGTVVLTCLGSVALLTWKSTKVSEARRDFKIPNPLDYSESCMTFNCIHRAFQSTMELYPPFLFLLMTGGLEMPYFSSLGGMIWILGRYVYAKGYYTGDPRRRLYGSFYIVGHLMVLVASCRFAIKRIFA